jgi:hypothetical protein
MEFTYNASALGAGGVIRDGSVTKIIPSIASVALAPTGGEGSSKVCDYYSEELGFKYAETYVSGAETAPNEYTTYTYVYIKDLRVFDDVLNIGAIRGTVTSTHRNDGDDDHEFTLRASYEDVRVRGRLIEPFRDVCIESLKRYRHLRDVIDATTGTERLLPPDLEPPTTGQGLAERFNFSSLSDLRTLVEDRRALHGSLIEGIKSPEGVSHRHNKVHIPGLGTVRFGELMLKPGRRRVNLLRLAFGANETILPFHGGDSPADEAVPMDGGSMTIASVEGNGTPIFP